MVELKALIEEFASHLGDVLLHTAIVDVKDGFMLVEVGQGFEREKKMNGSSYIFAIYENFK